MKNRQFTSRRQPKTKGQKMLHAITQKTSKKKKLRAVASNPAAGFDDVDKSLSSKIISGLFIALLLNIFAVAAIVLHGKFNKDNIERVKTTEGQKPVIQKGALALIEEDMSKISPSESYYWVRPGDTYQSIADAKGFDIEEFKRLNKNKPLRVGRSIKTPPRRIGVNSPEVDAIGSTPQVIVEEVSDDIHQITVVEPEPTSPAVQEQTESGITHTFSSGETFWSLSRKYNVSVSAIQQANAHLKPTAIKEGTIIKIPR